MSVEEIIGLIGLVVLALAGLWRVHHVLSVRIDAVHRDYVRRDDFLRVVERIEKKIDKLIEAKGN